MFTQSRITMLRPPETALIKRYEAEMDVQHVDYESKLAGERIDEKIDIIREAIGQISKSIDVPVRVYEHQLSDHPDIKECLRGLPGRKSTHWIHESTDIVIAFEAEQALIAYLCGLIRGNLILSAILVDKKEDDWIVPELKTPVFIMSNSRLYLARLARMHEINMNYEYDEEKLDAILTHAIDIKSQPFEFELPHLEPDWDVNERMQS